MSKSAIKKHLHESKFRVLTTRCKPLVENRTPRINLEGKISAQFFEQMKPR